MKISAALSLAMVASPSAHNNVHVVRAVLIGDEQYGDNPHGRFWAFHSTGFSVVDPATCRVEATVSSYEAEDGSATSLPTRWYDGVYMEPSQHEDDEDVLESIPSASDRDRRLGHRSDHHRRHGYVLINSGITKSDGHENLGGGTGEVFVLSTDPARLRSDTNGPVEAVVRVGGRPVHSYGVHPRDQFWTHSDETGEFFVIELDDLGSGSSGKHTGKPISAKVTEGHHGKLLWDESAALERHGFGTSTGERRLFVFDMDSHEQLLAYDYTDDLLGSLGSSALPYDNYCQGLHAIAYSSVNGHVYAECVAGGGTLEFDVRDPEAPAFVHQHSDVSGAIYETPDGAAVVVAAKGDNALHVLEPRRGGSKSSKKHTVNVPGNPSSPKFYPKPDGSGYVACMPLTENTNQNHYDASGNLACSYYGCSGARTAADVAAGVCLYDESGRTLRRATLDQIDQVRAGMEPFAGACERCQDPANYEEPDGSGAGGGGGTCVCTPYCGSCADPAYDASESGVRCVDLQDVFENGQTETTLIKGAGSVEQGSPYAYSPQCGFGRTYRTSKRGGKYDASVAHYPFPSLQIVNMESQELHCQARLPGKPDRVVYVPGYQSDGGKRGLSPGGVAGVVIAAIAGVGVLVVVILRRRSDIEAAGVAIS